MRVLALEGRSREKNCSRLDGGFEVASEKVFFTYQLFSSMHACMFGFFFSLVWLKNVFDTHTHTHNLMCFTVVQRQDVNVTSHRILYPFDLFPHR